MRGEGVFGQSDILYNSSDHEVSAYAGQSYENRRDTKY